MLRLGQSRRAMVGAGLVPALDVVQIRLLNCIRQQGPKSLTYRRK